MSIRTLVFFPRPTPRDLVTVCVTTCLVYLTVTEKYTHPHPHHVHTRHSHLHSGSSVSVSLPQRGLRLLRWNRCISIVVWWSTQCVRSDILKCQLFVLHNTDTISFPLCNSRFLRYNKQNFRESLKNLPTYHFKNTHVPITLSNLSSIREVRDV